MDIFDQILENLELERDLGTRTVEIDRALLVPPETGKAKIAEPAPAAVRKVAAEPVAADRPAAAPLPPQRKESSAPPSASDDASRAAVPDSRDAQDASVFDIAFFTGRPLSPEGTVAMEKTFAALEKLKPGARLCLNEERRAKVCVLLGSDALLKRIPNARPVRGNWVTFDGMPTVMTFSPDYIFTRFQKNSPNMNKAKLEMWNDIKLAVARI